MLYLRLAILFPAEKNNYKTKAKSLIDSCLDRLNGMIDIYVLCRTTRICVGKRTSFLAGDPGPLAIAAVIYNDLGDQKTVKRCVDQ